MLSRWLIPLTTCRDHATGLQASASDPEATAQSTPIARLTFLDPRAADNYPNWDAVADNTVAALRTEAGRTPYDKGLTHLVGELSTRSEDFRVRWDLSGSSRQARTCINGAALDAKTAIGAGLSMLLAVEAPFTSGNFRGIDVVLPPGTVASALPPDGVVFFFWEVSSAILSALNLALRHALGDRSFGGDFGSTGTHNAQGVHPSGEPWGTMAECGGEYGAWGASRAGDGDGYNTLYFVNMLSPSTEGIESNVPAMVLRKEYLPDTAGPGFNRGGAGMVKDIRYLQEAEHYTMPLRLKAPSGTGVYGGSEGRVGGVWIFDQEGESNARLPGTDSAAYAKATPVAGVLDPETNLPSDQGIYHYFGRVATWPTGQGATFRYHTNGGGGWGRQLQRDPERVARDVRNGYVTIEGAAHDYGVVVTGDPVNDPEGVSVDVKGTRILRESGTAESA
ncbi:hydantoinase B/oxoprolinase family protein [Streptomyces fractus]|uniref:hydantoinase B/oxoprolinase family protein n=1 Tax=Streptomyces fractus TaxID=641806 RepID=UPI003CF6C4C8